jgi:hypothetical protein
MKKATQNPPLAWIINTVDLLGCIISSWLYKGEEWHTGMSPDSSNPLTIRSQSKVNTTACTKQIMGSSVEEKREEVMEVRAKSKWYVVACLAISATLCDSVTSRVTHSLLSSDHYPPTHRTRRDRPDRAPPIPASAGRWHLCWQLETCATRWHHQPDTERGRMRRETEWNNRWAMSCLLPGSFQLTCSAAPSCTPRQRPTHVCVISVLHIMHVDAKVVWDLSSTEWWTNLSCAELSGAGLSSHA